MRTMHVFAGAGGGLLADLILGHNPVCAVEWDAHCCAVLRERAGAGWFPGLHVHEGDVRLFDPSDYAGRVDCIAAGFPCQDISSAGKGAGLDGERSGLWSQVVRVADVVRPRFLFLENSPAIVTRGLEHVLRDLSALGFDARWCVLPASAVGAPHIRARWFCFAWRADSNYMRKLQQERGKQNQRRRVGDVREDVADAHGEHEHGIWNERAGRWPEPADGGWWAVEPDVGRVAHGLAGRVDRLRAIGNGQVPAQAAAAFVMLAREAGVMTNKRKEPTT